MIIVTTCINQGIIPAIDEFYKEYTMYEPEKSVTHILYFIESLMKVHHIKKDNIKYTELSIIYQLFLIYNYHFHRTLKGKLQIKWNNSIIEKKQKFITPSVLYFYRAYYDFTLIKLVQ